MSRPSEAGPSGGCEQAELDVVDPIVGKVVYSSEEAQDDIDTQRNGGALFTPALTRLYPSAGPMTPRHGRDVT